MIDDQIRIIIDKYLLGEASEEDIQRLNAWYDAFDTRPALSALFSEEEKKTVANKMFSVISDAIEKCPDAEEEGIDENDIPACSHSDSVPEG